MAVSTHSIVLHWGPDFDRRVWGDPVLDGTETMRRMAHGLAPSAAPPYRDGIKLARDEVSGTYRTSVRVVGALSAWGPGQVVLRDGTDADDVRFRLHDGLGHQFYWTGTTWTAATLAAHWTEIGELYDHLPAYLSTANSHRLGFVFKLTRASASAASPVVAGVRAVVRVMFAQTSGDETRASSWHDDVAHRVLLGQAATEMVLPGSHEFTVKAGFIKIDYSKGVGIYPYDVQGVEAVYDVTADPRLRSPLAGTWSGSAKTWTPSAPPTVGHKLHSRFTYRPELAYSANDEFYTDTLPSLVVGGARLARRERGVGHSVVVCEAANAARVVESPDVCDLVVTCRLLAAKATDVQRMWMRVNEWLGGRVVYASPSTSLPVVLELVGGEPEVGVVGDHFEGRFEVLVDSLAVWNGREVGGHRLGSDGWSPEADEPSP